jgi:sulfate/thiosulfate transport system ATP-binding protein
MTISVRSLSKRFGATKTAALDDVTLDVNGGSLVALLGPSGSGKTTLLRCLSGLERPDTGSLTIDGNDLAAQSARQRNVGLVFQHYALFRHLTVFENIAFALRVRNRPKHEVTQRVNELLSLIQLEGHGDRISSPVANASASRSHARSLLALACCYSTSRSARSMLKSAPSSARGCASSMTRSTSRLSSSPTIKTKRSKSRTASS